MIFEFSLNIDSSALKCYLKEKYSLTNLQKKFGVLDLQLGTRSCYETLSYSKTLRIWHENISL
jgi:hypothetical protein